MEKYFYNRNFWAAMLMIFGGLILLLFISEWYENRQRKQRLPTVTQLTGEIEELEVSLQDAVERSRNKEMELESRDQLLEEKNIELAFMTDKLNKVAEINLSKEKEIAQLKKQLASSRSMLKEAYLSLESEREQQGLLYRVQIGMLEDEALPAFPFEPDMFLVEEVDNYNKYVLGSFRQYEASLEFRDLIRKLGVKDA
ncbi:MAG: hypothetical protein R8P61_22275 [Bacteroidia bacterium]|nr:hypothetical protein [Bacteroidia bacterium]